MLKFMVAMLFWVIWGVLENRVWKEAGESWILGHFKTYHIAIGVLDTIISGVCATNVFQFLFLLMWAPLALDVTWWIIRHIDFKRDPVTAEKLYQETNPWHLQTDWDNLLGLPLVAGCYWWWWVLGALGAIFGVLGFAV
jgi:hypothetical protein